MSKLSGFSCQLIIPFTFIQSTHLRQNKQRWHSFDIRTQGGRCIIWIRDRRQFFAAAQRPFRLESRVTSCTFGLLLWPFSTMSCSSYSVPLVTGHVTEKDPKSFEKRSFVPRPVLQCHPGLSLDLQLSLICAPVVINVNTVWFNVEEAEHGWTWMDSVFL